MTFGTLFGTIATVLVLAGVGVALRWAHVLERGDAKALNSIIIYAGLPALVFRALHGADLEWSHMLVALVAWAAILVGFSVSFAASKLLHLPPKTAGGFILCASLGNTGYLGYPLALSFFGDEGLVRAILYDVFGTVLGVLTIGLIVAQHYGDNGGKKANFLREVATFPAVVALVVALASRPVSIPVVVSDGLEALANLVVPLIMISLGLSLEPKAVGARMAALSTAAITKLALLPAIAAVVGVALLGDVEAVRLVVMQAGMPSMMLTLVFGLKYDLDVEFIASVILVTTVGAVLSVPAAQLLVG